MVKCGRRMGGQGRTERASAAGGGTGLKTILMLVTCGVVAVTGSCHKAGNLTKRQQFIVSNGGIFLGYKAKKPAPNITISVLRQENHYPREEKSWHLDNITQESGWIYIYDTNENGQKKTVAYISGLEQDKVQYDDLKLTKVEVNTTEVEWTVCLTPAHMGKSNPADGGGGGQRGVPVWLVVMVVLVLLVLVGLVAFCLVHYHRKALEAAKVRGACGCGLDSASKTKEQHPLNPNFNTQEHDNNIYEEWNYAWLERKPVSRHDSKNSLYQSAGP
ncbi:hypothetical protein Pcinc_015244 [Petrolisthes cinctipes]|uniref:Uncharacterized protein n=1 Tax=Petrolisthes cinctipes TaxID=88211 RepID=A0AAE1KQN1_PETCI|nr:hypothetical protein Pcinc_015244 [Petrolisthes cinctipes]